MYLFSCFTLVQGSSGDKHRKSLDRTHETYRLLRRKNLIIEAVQNLKVIDGLFPSVCAKDLK